MCVCLACTYSSGFGEFLSLCCWNDRVADLGCGSLNVVAIVDWANPIPDLFFCTCTSSPHPPLLSSFPAHPTCTDIAPISRHRRLPHLWLPTRHLANLVQHRFSAPKLSRPPLPLQTLSTLLSHHPRPGYWTPLRSLPLLLIPLLRPCFSVSSLAGSIPLYPYSLGPRSPSSFGIRTWRHEWWEKQEG